MIKEALIKAKGIASDPRKSVTERVVKRFNQRFLNIKKNVKFKCNKKISNYYKYCHRFRVCAAFVY